MSLKKSKKILLFTRPLVPPWDEASKNLAFDIAKNCKGNFSFKLLTSNKKELLDALGFDKTSSFIQQKFQIEKIYSSSEFNLFQKIRLLIWFFFSGSIGEVIHFLFTPRSLTSFLIRLRLFFSQTKTIQTVATFHQNITSTQKLKKIFFADQIVAQSRYTQQKLENCGISNTKLIYPGIDLEKFKPAFRNENLMIALGIEPKDFVFLYPGEYSRLKALENILAFLKILKEKKELENWKFIFACRIKNNQDAQEKKRFQNKIKSLEFQKKIIFIDTFRNMPALYNLSDLVFFPIREMTGKFDIPLVLIEAMATKKPVLVSDIPVLKEFIKPNETGLVVPPQNPTKIYETFIYFYKNKDLLEKIAQQGFQFVQKNFNIKINAQKYKQLYKNLLK